MRHSALIFHHLFFKPPLKVASVWLGKQILYVNRFVNVQISDIFSSKKLKVYYDEVLNSFTISFLTDNNVPQLSYAKI